VCRALQDRHLTGCGYSWAPSSNGAASPDVDGLASALGAQVASLIPTHGHAVTTAVACPVMNRPNPGSTPCGACQIGVATPTHVYLSLDAHYAADTTLYLRTDAQSLGSVVVRVPAHAATFDAPMKLPADFAGGVTLSLPSEGML
jgi:hypothetical protein